jgi:uncharacterized UBP type Zn finger protein
MADGLRAMGFQEHQVTKAMKECGDNVEAAANYIMGHLDEPDEFWFAPPEASEAPPAAAARDYPPDDAGDHAAVLAPFLAMARVPTAADVVHKEECAWSFARPTSVDGLNISLRSFLGVGKAHLDFHAGKTGDKLYLNVTSRRKQVDPDAQAAAEVSSVADAVNQKAAAAQKEYDSKYTLVALTDGAPTTVPVEVNDGMEVQTLLPGTITAAIEAVLKATDSGTAVDLAEFKDVVAETKYHKDLVQENNGKKMAPHKEQWKCDKTGDQIGEGPGHTASLWLNLSDGFGNPWPAPLRTPMLWSGPFADCLPRP